MRILFVSETYYPHLNGVYYFVCRIAPLLQEKGHEVAVIAPSENTHSAKKKIDGIDIYVMPSLPLLFYPKLRFPVPFMLQSKIGKIILDFKPDVIHLQDHFILSKAVIEINKKLNIPVVGTNHFMPENITTLFKNKGLKKGVERFLWSRFSHVFNQVLLVTTPTETGARLIRPHLNTKVIPISSGIDLDEFNASGQAEIIRKKYGLPDNPILLYVGRIDPEKRIEEILEAVAVAAKTINFCFVVVGKGVCKDSLEARSAALNLQDRVIFTGFVSNEDLPHFYRISRCFIIASRAELLSLVTLQAMASGLPVIAVNAGALPELVHDNVNGFLFETDDQDVIVQSIQNIFSDDKLHQRMAARSLEFSLDHDISRTVSSFEKVYNGCFTRRVVTNSLSYSESI
jgi:glycosyltransferase involved in cell wall biosynthesis